MNAKEILKNKFWIVEDKGVKIGTISLNDEKYIFSNGSGSTFFNTTNDLSKNLGGKINWQELVIKEKTDFIKEVHGYPTSSSPYNSIYDVKKKLPLFTKSEKSKSLYCAGYYIIRFDKGWVKSFCPKLITIERYNYKGPFLTEIEMRTELSRVNSA